MRFGRRRSGDVEETDADATGDTGVADTASDDPRAHGPWDVSEVQIDEDDDSRLDLGCLLVPPRDDLDVQLQVEEATGQVVAVVVAGQSGVLELRAFAAPRHGDVWETVRKGLAAEVAQMGGTASEQDGPFGTELAVALQVELEDGQRAEQRSRVVGVSGPRWLLRATLFGQPGLTHDESDPLEQLLREVVVVRGGTPVPPGDPLPLTMPAHVHPVEPDSGPPV